MFVYIPHLIQGDASKSNSDVDIYARSLDDVSGCKKDLSASSGETHRLLFTLKHMTYSGLNKIIFFLLASKIFTCPIKKLTGPTQNNG